MTWVTTNTTVFIPDFMKISEVVQKFKSGDKQMASLSYNPTFPPVRKACKLKTLSEGCNEHVPARKMLGHTALL
jgi:hypothetical protein